MLYYWDAPQPCRRPSTRWIPGVASMKPLKLISIAAAVVLGGILIYSFTGADSEPPAPASAPPPTAKLPVEVVKVSAQMAERTVALPAELTPYEGTDIYA